MEEWRCKEEEKKKKKEKMKEKGSQITILHKGEREMP